MFTIREDCILRSSSFWVPRNLSHHMIKQTRTDDTVLVKSKEMAGRTQKLSMVAGGREGVKTTENKMHWPRWLPFAPSHISIRRLFLKWFLPSSSNLPLKTAVPDVTETTLQIYMYNTLSLCTCIAPQRTKAEGLENWRVLIFEIECCSTLI